MPVRRQQKKYDKDICDMMRLQDQLENIFGDGLGSPYGYRLIFILGGLGCDRSSKKAGVAEVCANRCFQNVSS